MKDLTEFITVRFPKSTVDALKKRQAAVGIPPSEFIRRAVKEALEPLTGVDLLLQDAIERGEVEPHED